MRYLSVTRSIPAFVVVSLLLTACGGVPAHRSQNDAMASLDRKPRIAVMDFQVLSSDASFVPLGSDVPQAIIARFVKVGRLVPVERSDLDSALKEIELSETGIIDDNQALRVGKLLGAEWLLLGSITPLGETVKIQCRLLRTETGEIVCADSEIGKTSKLFDVEVSLASKTEEAIVSALNHTP